MSIWVFIPLQSKFLEYTYYWRIFFYKKLPNDQFLSCKYTYVDIFSRFIEEISYDFHVNKIEQWFNIRHFGEPQKQARTWALVFSSLRSSARLRS